MRAATHAAQRPLYGLAPAWPHGDAHHLLHRVRALLAFAKRRVITRAGDLANRQLVVERGTYGHAVNRRARRHVAALERVQRIGLAVAQFGLDVPQAVLAVVSAKDDGAGVQMGSGLGCRQGHERFSLSRQL